MTVLLELPENFCWHNDKGRIYIFIIKVMNDFTFSRFLGMFLKGIGHFLCAYIEVLKLSRKFRRT